MANIDTNTNETKRAMAKACRLQATKEILAAANSAWSAHAYTSRSLDSNHPAAKRWYRIHKQLQKLIKIEEISQ